MAIEWPCLDPPETTILHLPGLEVMQRNERGCLSSSWEPRVTVPEALVITGSLPLGPVITFDTPTPYPIAWDLLSTHHQLAQSLLIQPGHTPKRS